MTEQEIQERKIELRIACEEAGYPYCEALYSSIEDYEKKTGELFSVCSKCYGEGWYQYDHNHSTVCDCCCEHDGGSWLLLEHYGINNGKWCCMLGCGHIEDKSF